MPEPAATVFVVEDDPSVREALAGLIRSAGWSVEVFDSAHEFLARPKAEAPSCLVLDVGLPGLSGRTTTTSRSSSSPATATFPCRCGR
jgi:FixJ family two-component response regulator